jgi:hypothetical protein
MNETPGSKKGERFANLRSRLVSTSTHMVQSPTPRPRITLEKARAWYLLLEIFQPNSVIPGSTILDCGMGFLRIWNKFINAAYPLLSPKLFLQNTSRYQRQNRQNVKYPTTKPFNRITLSTHLTCRLPPFLEQHHVVYKQHLLPE